MTPEEQARVEEVRETIEAILIEEAEHLYLGFSHRIAARLLKELKGKIGILHPDQSKPENRYRDSQGAVLGADAYWGYRQAQQDMLNDNWRRIIKQEIPDGVSR